MPGQCEDLSRDRRKGEKAEIEFCQLMKDNDFDTVRLQAFTKGRAASLEHQDNHIVLADIFLIAPNNNILLAEIKEKYPNKYNSYGLEEYRLNHYLEFQKITGIPVMYAIKDVHDEGKWFWNNLDSLIEYGPKKFMGSSWVDGREQRVLIYYFQKTWFKEILKDLSLTRLWKRYHNYNNKKIIQKIKKFEGINKFQKTMDFLKETISDKT
ncbi:MAG: hypothetical protein GF308_21265 [Candidatus Heimdallarchaeota archaeon]|nr:hypothetical protein [Candidatus Heimdallarchaeota archaeon]